MQAEQTLGIALPLEALVWAEASGGAWIGYNDPGVAGRRHALGHDITTRWTPSPPGPAPMRNSPGWR
jgi:hypothetical protein